MPRKVKTIEQTQPLEELVMQTSYRVRDNSLTETKEAIIRILQPRATYSYDGSSTHFLPLPSSPAVAINRAGMPSEADKRERQRFQAALTEVTEKENTLRATAQKANGMIPTLFEWAVSLGKAEDRLLISAPLTEQDRPAVESYIAEHRRYLRTCQAWCEKLRF